MAGGLRVVRLALWCMMVRVGNTAIVTTNSLAANDGDGGEGVLLQYKYIIEEQPRFFIFTNFF